MTKKVIGFDLDDTLAVSKSPISVQMAGLLKGLLNHYQVCIISGGKFEQFKTQVIDKLPDGSALQNLHIMPTCGTRYVRYDVQTGKWQLQYAEDLTEEQKSKIIKVLEASAKQVGLWAEKPYGDIIEDRGSQVTYSALGQKAPADKKYQWAKAHAKDKIKLRDAVSRQLPDLEVRLGGTTSVDITRKGIDKSYGMTKLIEALHATKDSILYLGDKLDKGGNDYPVKAMGIDTIAVTRWEDTALVLEGILGVSD